VRGEQSYSTWRPVRNRTSSDGPVCLWLLTPHFVVLCRSGVTSCLCHLAYANEIKPRIMAATPQQLQLHKTYHHSHHFSTTHSGASHHLHYSQRAGAQEGVLGMSGSVKGITILFAAFFPNAVLLLVPVISHRSSPSSPP
jgi:hypothetical protein